MKRMLLAVVAVVVSLTVMGCAGKPLVLAPVAPTNVVVVGDITPRTGNVGNDDSTYEKGWTTPAPQYEALALEFREVLITELQKSFIVFDVGGEPPAELEAFGHPLVLKNLHFIHLPPNVIRWMGWVGFSTQIYQDGKKVAELLYMYPTSMLIAASMHKELLATDFVNRRIKRLLPSLATATTATP